jgi:hypothetical protein
VFSWAHLNDGDDLQNEGADRIVLKLIYIYKRGREGERERERDGNGLE